MNQRLKNLSKLEPVKFLTGGVGMKIVSFILNYILADLMQLNIELTYVFVLLVDFIMGYFINRFYVFTKSQTKSHKETFSKFIIAGLSFRALNWLIYIIILKSYEIYILWAQAFATIIVLVLKYFLYKRIFR